MLQTYLSGQNSPRQDKEKATLSELMTRYNKRKKEVWEKFVEKEIEKNPEKARRSTGVRIVPRLSKRTTGYYKTYFYIFPTNHR